MHENLGNASNASSPAFGQPSASASTVSLSTGAPTMPLPTGLLPPLVVDLDGTLIKTDLLVESACGLLRQDPLRRVADHLKLFDMVLQVMASPILPQNANERDSPRNSEKRVSTMSATNLATWQCGLPQGEP